MENKVINKKAEIAEIVKIFKQNLELKSSEINEKRLKILKGCFQTNEKTVNNKDETGFEYINDELNTIKRVFKGFDYAPEPVSTFTGTPDLIKNKKYTINPQNYKNNKCFQYSIIICLYHKEIKNNPERISKIKPFINNLNWENFSSLQFKDYQQFGMNNKSVALNILQIHEEKISHFYKSGHNKTRESKVILLMISDNEKKHYLAVKNLNALLKKRKIIAL